MTKFKKNTHLSLSLLVDLSMHFDFPERMCMYQSLSLSLSIVTCDFQQFDILTSVDSDEPLQPPFKLRNSNWCSVSSLTIIEYSCD